MRGSQQPDAENVADSDGEQSEEEKKEEAQDEMAMSEDQPTLLAKAIARRGSVES